MKSPPPLGVALISLGCAKNLVDSEVMLGALLRAGMEFRADPATAEVVIVNTCGFIEAAKEESVQAILRAKALRETGRCRALIMAGCLTQRYPAELRRELPEVDAFIGLNEVPRIAEIVQAVLEKVGSAPNSGDRARDTNSGSAAPELYWSGPARFVPDFASPRFRLTPRHFGYVKIAEGCDHPCSFCSIPRIRGRHRSRPPADVLREVRALVGAGAREINLISQDTTFYGQDLRPSRGADGAPSLAGLLRDIQRIEGDFWVRLLYTHPAHWDDELIETIAACDKVCRYVDLPLQHINHQMLRRMRRETGSEYIRGLVRRLRAGIPGLALRTAFIVGFPGETEAQFAELLEFIEEARFERLGIFRYSREDHTPAGAMSEQVPVAVKRRRYRRAMALQQAISRAIQRQQVGRTLRVLIEKPLARLPAAIPIGHSPRRGRWWQGRSQADAPGIDGCVYVRGATTAGEFAEVKVCDAAEYDLVATPARLR